MARQLGSYMLVARLLQSFIAFIIIGSNGYLINYIILRRLGLGPNMVAIEIIASIILFHNLIQILVLHVLHKSAVKRFLLISLCWDLISTTIIIANMTILSIAGVPSNCQGMTRSNYEPGDAPNNPAAGFVTVRFGSGTFGNHGELDVYCSLPQAAYGLSVLAIFLSMALVTFTALRVFSYGFVRASDLENNGAAACKLKANSEHSVPSPTFPNPAHAAGNLEREIDLNPKTNGLIYGTCSRSPSSASAMRVVNGSRGRAEGARSPPPYIPGDHIEEAAGNAFGPGWETKTATWQ